MTPPPSFLFEEQLNPRLTDSANAFDILAVCAAEKEGMG